APAWSFSLAGAHPSLPSFPTRRSSDLVSALAAEVALVQPKDLAAELTKGGKPAVFQVGPNLMYRSRHIAGAVYAGPGSKAEGLRSEEHTSELQSLAYLVCRLLLEEKMQ